MTNDNNYKLIEATIKGDINKINEILISGEEVNGKNLSGTSLKSVLLVRAVQR